MKKDKVLYMCHLSEGTGWSKAAIDSILSLKAIDVDVVVRNVRLTNNFVEYPEEIVELERKECYDADYCIQHLLPHHLCGTNKYKKNVAYLEYEVSSLNNTYWKEPLLLMDGVWVPNKELHYQLLNGGFKPCHIPHATDITKYYIRYPDIHIPELDHTFKFYTICDLNDRKNLETVIKCFHATFDRSEPVSLILKVKKYGFDEAQLTQYVSNICNNVKQSLRLYADPSQYHRECIIAKNLRDEEVMSLHQYGDCYVCASHGEAWNIPAFDAMAMNKIPIVPAQGGHLDYIKTDFDGDNGMLVKTCNKICTCSDAAFPDLFTGRDFWCDVDEKDFCEKMRLAYEGKKSKRSIVSKTIAEYSYDTVGHKMMKALKGEE
jgi:hypothetical protein